MNRRSVILGGAAVLALPFVRARAAGPNFAANPFSLGVASGCPTADSCVLWTGRHLLCGPGVPVAQRDAPDEERWHVLAAQLAAAVSATVN